MLMNQILYLLTFDPNDPLPGNDKWYPLDLMTPAQVERTGVIVFLIPKQVWQI